MATYDNASGLSGAVQSSSRINNAIYEYLVGVIPDTKAIRVDLLNNAELTANAAKEVFNQYSEAVHQIVQTIAPHVKDFVKGATEATALTTSLISTIGVQIEYSQLVEEIREVLTGEASPDTMFARMQQVLYLILLKKAREIKRDSNDSNISYEYIKNDTGLVRQLANTDDVMYAIQDMLSIYYDLIYGKSPMVHIESRETAEERGMFDNFQVSISSVARTLENEEWDAQQNAYKNLANDLNYRIWFLNNILKQADDSGVVRRDMVDHSFLSGIEVGNLQELKNLATNAYKMNLNADIKRIVDKYNYYVRVAINRYAKAGKFNTIREDIVKVWNYIKNEQIEKDVHSQVVALNFIMNQCLDNINRINNAIRDKSINVNVNQLIATDGIDISVKQAEGPTIVNVSNLEWGNIMREDTIKRMNDAADLNLRASAGAGPRSEEKEGGRRRQYRQTRKTKRRRRTSTRRTRKTANKRKRRTMKRKINRRRKTRR
jgi:hypothetical protein